ncbi:PhnD/SsuA/transferrin family substrate-binding protein [Thiomicrospira cyclica]|uniref:Phosphonate ABC transporter, periplasmic phosphonate-binding protein n=1 Tax=Thiomicrospira cyclica (strain DSM 14477 / JCM 11371 / ALM1) TaxID=717773 RepID=F6DAV7_THICA|nr:PhnD/SsuA/transferrin family substrate-binding protein [Thiomicrospira cyclica]AEG31200.1 hypothetical protein Thicy_0426 [Thiomicrospira cyclica ALM1]
MASRRLLLVLASFAGLMLLAIVLFLLWLRPSLVTPVHVTSSAIEHANETSAAGLVLAVLPYEMPSQINQRFKPLTDYLSTLLQQPVQLYISQSYEDQIQRLSLGEVDLAYMGAAAFVKTQKNLARQEQSLQLIAAEASYRAAVVVHQDSAFKELADLKHHSLAFGSYHSYSGHFIIRQLLRLEEIYLTDLAFYNFLGRHERAIMSVVHQDYHAAATTEGLAQRFIDLGYPIRILRTSELLAPTVLVSNQNVSAAQRHLIIEALLFQQTSQHDFNFFEVDHQEFEEVERILNLIER